MFQRIVLTASASILGLSLLGACQKEEAATPAAAEEKPAVDRPAVVAGYDLIRERLADDDLEGAKKAAAALDSENTYGLKALAEALIEQEEILEAREAFGDLSKKYLALLVHDTELQEGGLIAFRCPMATGYQKWVQYDEPMMNPYMGKEMLECGSKVDLEP